MNDFDIVTSSLFIIGIFVVVIIAIVLTDWWGKGGKS